MAKSVGAAPAANQVFGYAVTACNRFGESAPVFFVNIAAQNLAIITAATLANDITLTVNNPAIVGPNPTEYFIIYRTLPRAFGSAVSANTADYSEIARLRCVNQGGGAVGASPVDSNAIMPFTQTAYLGEMTPSVLTFRQLAPLMRMDLAVLAPAYRWMIMLYGTPVLFAPAKWTRLTNIGRLG